MKYVHSFVAALIVVVSMASMNSEDRLYEGQWNTTNRKLDGVMTCVVREVGDQKWQGRFHGIWQGVPFDHTVPFSGPATNLRGSAVIDGAHYDWTGTITQETGGSFKGSFGGSRYTGYFDLKPKTASAVVATGTR